MYSISLGLGRTTRSILTPLALLLSLLALVPACGRSDSAPTPGAGGTGEPAPDPDAPGLHETGPGRYTAVVYSAQGIYDPDEIRVPVGAEVTFRLITDDEMVHGFTIEGTDVELLTAPPEDAVATHTFTDAGEYPFWCQIYCGGGHDIMRGRVIVE